MRISAEAAKRCNALVSYISNGLAYENNMDKALYKITYGLNELIRLCNYAAQYTRSYAAEECISMNIRYEQMKTEINNLQSLESFKEYCIHTIMVFLQDNVRRYSYIDMYDVNIESRYTYSALMDGNGNYYLDDDNMDTLCEHINLNTKNRRSFAIFNPQCGDGKDLKNLADRLNIPVATYGLEMDIYGMEQAKENVNRMIKGQIKGSTINNNIFDIVYVYPRLQFNIEKKPDGKFKETNELYVLKNSIKYLKENGLFIYTINWYALNPEMKLFISKHLDNLSFYTWIDDKTGSNHGKSMVTMLGYKKEIKDYLNTYTNLLYIDYETLQDLPCRNYIVDNESDFQLNLFRGSELDMTEIEDMLNNDGLYNDFYKCTEIKDTLKDTKPLLPFNIGQVGLILSSGCLDGIVEEDNGAKHIIKGMTIKESCTVTESIDNRGQSSVSATETISNRVQISAFDANGEFYTLM